ncbi:hypothetical protein ALC152_07190 [Arcobacter sp. 15-2]|uniref:hypothetical protein n=1 Tax=Arcobacter sp. 15-2 TaxID=3374109 RepID=UPI00399CFAE3
MKRLLFIVISLGLFLSTVNAACAKWEATGGTAPGDYCWEISKIEKTLRHNGNYHDDVYEDLRDKTETHYEWFATIPKMMSDGEYYYGIYIYYDVYGIPGRQPSFITFDKAMSTVLVEQSTILSPSGNIVNGTRYKYFIAYKKASKVTGINDVNIKGKLTVYSDSFNVLRTMKIN